MSKLSNRVAALEAVAGGEAGTALDLTALTPEQFERMQAIKARVDDGETVEMLPTDDLRFICGLPLRCTT